LSFELRVVVLPESIAQKKTFAFALDVIRLYCKLRDQHEYVLSKQLLRSGTSIGANVEEALAAQSRNDFLSKMAYPRWQSHQKKPEKHGTGYVSYKSPNW
jgi:hypothetical protein